MMALSLCGFLVFGNTYDVIMKHLTKILGRALLWCHEIKCKKLSADLTIFWIYIEFTFLILFRGPYEFDD